VLVQVAFAPHVPGCEVCANAKVGSKYCRKYKDASIVNMLLDFAGLLLAYSLAQLYALLVVCWNDRDRVGSAEEQGAARSEKEEEGQTRQRPLRHGLGMESVSSIHFGELIDRVGVPSER